MTLNDVATLVIASGSVVVVLSAIGAVGAAWFQIGDHARRLESLENWRNGSPRRARND